MRNHLCALTSPSGGFGFTCGVEWLAAEKIRVHGNTGLNWGAAENIVPELAQLNRLIAGHPCFFDGAKLTRLSAPDSPVYALLRESADGKDSVLVLANTDVASSNQFALATNTPKIQILDFNFNLVGELHPLLDRQSGEIIFPLAAGACHCLAPTERPVGLNGDEYRRARAQAAFALESLNQIVPAETVDGLDWRRLAEQVASSPKYFLAAASEFATLETKIPFADLLAETAAGKIYPRVVTWTLLDFGRIRARIAASEARTQKDLAAYEQTLATALEETEGAFAQFSRSAQRRDSLSRAEASSGEATRLARLRYEAGVTDFLAVLDAELSATGRSFADFLGVERRSVDAGIALGFAASAATRLAEGLL